MTVVRCAQGVVDGDLKAVVVREIHAEALSGPEIRTAEGVADDVAPPLKAEVLRSLERRALEEDAGEDLARGRLTTEGSRCRRCQRHHRRDEPHGGDEREHPPPRWPEHQCA